MRKLGLSFLVLNILVWSAMFSLGEYRALDFTWSGFAGLYLFYFLIIISLVLFGMNAGQMKGPMAIICLLMLVAVFAFMFTVRQPGWVIANGSETLSVAFTVTGILGGLAFMGYARTYFPDLENG